MIVSASEYSSSVPVERPRPRMEIFRPCFLIAGEIRFSTNSRVCSPSLFRDSARTISLRPFVVRCSIVETSSFVRIFDSGSFSTRERELPRTK